MVDWTVYFIFEHNLNINYIIKKNETIEFISLNPNGIYNIFKTSENSVENYPTITFIKGKNNIIIK